MVEQKISFPEAFTEPCNASLQTIKNVTKCPANRSSFETAARRKNCSSLAGEARNCKSFQYHCVLGIDLKSAIELCAPSINIIGRNGNTHGVVIFAVTALTCIMIVLVGSTVAVCRRRRFESRSAEGQSSISSGDGLLKKPQKGKKLRHPELEPGSPGHMSTTLTTVLLGLSLQDFDA
uniref:Uncharacterized protein n=1 Tax=Magallana gigas TaxID=29159 RepID=K1R548_MAGGI